MCSYVIFYKVWCGRLFRLKTNKYYLITATTFRRMTEANRFQLCPPLRGGRGGGYPPSRSDPRMGGGQGQGGYPADPPPPIQVRSHDGMGWVPPPLPPIQVRSQDGGRVGIRWVPRAPPPPSRSDPRMGGLGQGWGRYVQGRSLYRGVGQGGYPPPPPPTVQVRSQDGGGYPLLEQHSVYSIAYASCVHAGGLSCWYGLLNDHGWQFQEPHFLLQTMFSVLWLKHFCPKKKSFSYGIVVTVALRIGLSTELKEWWRGVAEKFGGRMS